MGINKSKLFNYDDYINSLYNKVLKCNIIEINDNINTIIYYKNTHIITKICLHKCYLDMNKKDLYNTYINNKINKILYLEIIKNKDDKMEVMLYENKNEYKKKNSINDDLIKQKYAHQNKYFYRPKTPFKRINKDTYSSKELNIRDKMFIELKNKVYRRNTLH